MKKKNSPSKKQINLAEKIIRESLEELLYISSLLDEREYKNPIRIETLSLVQIARLFSFNPEEKMFIFGEISGIIKGSQVKSIKNLKDKKIIYTYNILWDAVLNNTSVRIIEVDP